MLNSGLSRIIGFQLWEILCSARGRALTSSAREQSSMGRGLLACTKQFFWFVSSSFSVWFSRFFGFCRLKAVYFELF
jgi:hypothetical protein